MSNVKKIAVIGAGIVGLSTSYYLQSQAITLQFLIKTIQAQEPRGGMRTSLQIMEFRH